MSAPIDGVAAVQAPSRPPDLAERARRIAAELDVRDVPPAAIARLLRELAAGVAPCQTQREDMECQRATISKIAAPSAGIGATQAIAKSVVPAADTPAASTTMETLECATSRGATAPDGKSRSAAGVPAVDPLAAEREACALACEAVGKDWDHYDDVTAMECAKVIRERNAGVTTPLEGRDG